MYNPFPIYARLVVQSPTPQPGDESEASPGKLRKDFGTQACRSEEYKQPDAFVKDCNAGAPGEY